MQLVIQIRQNQIIQFNMQTNINYNNSHHYHSHSQKHNQILNSELQIDRIARFNHKIVFEIINFFNIPIQSHSRLEQICRIIKQKFIQICLNQKQSFLRYLKTIKFKYISQEVYDLVVFSLNQISQILFNPHQNKQPNQEQILKRYIPKLQKIQDIQNFHLKMLEIYQKSQLFPNIHFDQVKKQQIDNKNYFVNNFQQKKPQQFVKFIQVEENTIGKNKSVFKPLNNQSTINEFSNYFDFMNPFDFGNKNQKVKLKKLKIEFPIPINDLKNNISMDRDNNKFINCVCEGQQLIISKWFQCNFCSKRYHFKCLSIKEQIKFQKCPVCEIETQKSQQFQLIKPAILKQWIKIDSLENKYLEEQNYIILSHEKLYIMKQIASKQHHFVCLRMIKRKNSNISEQSSEQLQQYSQQIALNISSIQIPLVVIQKLMLMDQPFLELNFMKFKQIQRNNIRKELIYYGIYEAKRKENAKVQQQSE